MRLLLERDATSTSFRRQSPFHPARRPSFTPAKETTRSKKAIPQSGTCSGEDIASSGTMRETLLHCSTVKGIKWTHSKWSLSKQPSPRLTRPGSSILRFDYNKNRGEADWFPPHSFLSCARNLSGPV